MNCKASCPNKNLCEHGYCKPHQFSYCKGAHMTINAKGRQILQEAIDTIEEFAPENKQ